MSEPLIVTGQRGSSTHSIVSSPFLGRRLESLNALFDQRRLIPTPYLYPWVVHGHLSMVFPSGVEGRGTATLIGKNHVITAGHCFYDDEEGGLVTEATIYFGRHGNKFLRKTSIDRFIVHPAYLKNDENYDLAVGRASEDIGDELGYASLIVPDDTTLKNKSVAVTGYPGTQGFLGTFFNLPSYHMYSMQGPIVLPRKHKIYYHIDTSGGQSGSGVWILNPEEIVQCLAVHTTGRAPREEGNGAVRINEENYGIITDWLKAL